MENDLLNTYGAVYYGRVTNQMRGQIGGTREVFVPIVDIKNHQVFPTTGGLVKNPFKRMGKMYAGDLVEYRWNGNGKANKHEQAEIILLKTFEVQAASSAATVFIKRDGFRHQPSIGDVLMKAPAEFATAGTAHTVVAVEKTTNSNADVWKLTFSAAIGSLTAGDILVEGDKDGTDAKMLVQNPNAVLPCDYDFKYAPAENDEDFDGARYYLTPTLHALMYEILMSPTPEVVKKLNKSNVDGWFEI